MAHRANVRASRLGGLSLLVTFFTAASLAQAAPPTSIILDGSFGAPGNITASSPHLFSITPSMGRTVGANLFQSFGTFNVGTGDVALFSANVGTQNILARVTGGSPSSIDGILASPVNLFFLNPAGVMFTANAQVSVTGSFVVSTANYAKLGDGNIFYADTTHPIADTGLTASPVAAFGFLPGSTPAPISFTNAIIGSQPTASQAPSTLTGLQVIGGDISLDAADLFAPGGVLTLFSAAGPGEVPFNLHPAETEYANPGVTQFGAISLTNGARAEIDNLTGGGGVAVIRGGKITVDSSDITSGNYGPVAGGDIMLTADQLSLTTGGFVATGSFSSAQAGSVTVNVNDLLYISGPNSQGGSAQISADTEVSGNGGTVTVNAGSIDLNDGNIRANTDGSGQGGTVNVTADSMTMATSSELASSTDGSGNAGTINLTLTSGALTMRDSAGITADTFTTGNGGNITISAPIINMTGQALISANTELNSGVGGTINILQNNSLSIQGNGAQPVNSLGIIAQSLSQGNAGVININSAMVSLGGGAVISSAALNTSKGGSVTLNCNQAELTDGSQISTASNSYDAGPVQITATDYFSLTGGSSVSASAAQSGGAITIKAGELLYLLNSNIVAYAGNPQPTRGDSQPPPPATQNISGGNISIDPDFVVLDNSLISANDLSTFGHDGNILNSADYFFTSGSTLHATGTIETTPPDLDLAGSLAFLPADLVNAATQLRERCDRAANHEFSTFIVVGRGGVENAPEEFRPDFGLSPHLAAPGAGDATVR